MYRNSVVKNSAIRKWLPTANRTGFAEDENTPTSNSRGCSSDVTRHDKSSNDPLPILLNTASRELAKNASKQLFKSAMYAWTFNI